MKKIIISLLAVFLAILALGAGCKREAPVTEKETEKDLVKPPLPLDIEEPKDKRQYNWSTMKEGPYRDKVSFATSTDLLRWTDSKKILAEHASVPGAVYKDGMIYVYFVDVSQDGLPEQLGLIKSEDEGLSWSDKEIIIIEGIGTKVAVDPAPYLLDDGRIRLYYFDINISHEPGIEHKIYSAISNDALNFKEEEGVRFSDPGVLDPDVIKVGDTWRMYTGEVEKNVTVSATSEDGLNFEKEGVAFSGGAVPDVFYKDGLYYLFTAGINIATSKDGQSFISTANSFRSNLGMITADPSVIELKDGSYMMLYKTQEGRPGMMRP